MSLYREKISEYREKISDWPVKKGRSDIGDFGKQSKR